ncbi:hypothetical protein [Planococcus sp. YIM B11945]|uniref:hypothetical protein n=1 Tax=Planococcus sp. YIM B11945 TaxID=3435410 RepID=UPI003D7D58DF
MSLFFFKVIIIIVSVITFRDFLRIEISKSSVISLVATSFVLIGFLTYTFIFLIGYQVFPYFEATQNIDDKIVLMNLLESKSVYEQFTYFATLAGLYALLQSNFDKEYLLPRLKKKTTGKLNTELEVKIHSLEEDIRLRKILLEHYTNKQKK